MDFSSPAECNHWPPPVELGLRPAAPATLMGFCPLQHMSARGIHFTRRCHPPVRSAYKVFHPLDGLLPPKPTRPCFMPGALLRFYPSGFSPPDEPHSSRSRCSLAVLTKLQTIAWWRATVTEATGRQAPLQMPKDNYQVFARAIAEAIARNSHRSVCHGLSPKQLLVTHTRQSPKTIT